MGLRLSPEKTLITHIDEGLDFLGLAHPAPPQARHQPVLRLHLSGTKAVKAVTGKVKTLCRQIGHEPAAGCPAAPAQPDAAGLVRLLPARRVQRDLRLPERLHLGRVMGWLRRKHRRITWKELRRRYCGGGWWPGTTERTLFNPAKVRTTRYRYRGAAIPTPWPATG